MRESAGILKTLLTFEPDKIMTASQIACIWGAKESKVRTYVGRYCGKGYLERLNPRQNPARYCLTPMAIQLLHEWRSKSSTKARRGRKRNFQMLQGRIVNSVFALGNI